MSKPTDKRSDSLLWLATAGIVGLTATWLLISKPWSQATSIQLPDPAVPTETTVAEQPPASLSSSLATPTPEPSAAGEPAVDEPVIDDLGNPLRMAQLAYEAGMLIEPEEYSAWTLFIQALDRNPRDPAARLGLERVAQQLLQRGEAAVEQGRLDDAVEILERIRSALPEHEGSLALAGLIEDAAPVRARPDIVAPTAPPPPEIQAARTVETLRPTQQPVPTPSPDPDSDPGPFAPEPATTPMAELNETFMSAMAENQLLTPAGASAKHYVETMLADDPTHMLAQGARDLLVTEMLSRSVQSQEALDWDSARTWVSEAERLTPNTGAVTSAREQLNEQIIAAESRRRLPAAIFTVRNSPPPEYPRNALTRDIEGWVEVDFTVAADGTTEDVMVADASHQRIFRDEAVEAVESWEFEPRVFMGRTIPQRSYIRLRFELED